MATTDQQTQPSRRNQVMVGELPEDFLCMPSSTVQQQMIADGRVAQVLQAQQARGFSAIPTNVLGKLNISIIQAKLTKNYGLTKMDPYVRIRLGHSVFETPTAYNGAKTPHWNKEVTVYLPHGVDSIYVEIFDERQFTMDDRIAWAYITIPQGVLGGDTADNWFPLSGKQGDEKEGMINLVMTFTPVENLPASAPTSFAYQQPMVVPNMYYTAPVVYPAPGQQLQQPRPQSAGQPQTLPPQGPLYTEDDLKQVKDMFPNMDEEAIKSVLEANRGNKDTTINALLQMSAE
ncbi:toll-interacting protein-like [Mizuhopecten yessoensis]|uniref:Toll-interacting protein n=1 Tax=Mizuhopecten yessoensis TaxID=6573 RepID=A0A210PI23_MIZYE|nr:toll-interacting protein-like [Mizuhopecten yessoensis]OWF36076.1 Toll-interacting protein [Mizuhopecten yessoensis]